MQNPNDIYIRVSLFVEICLPLYKIKKETMKQLNDRFRQFTAWEQQPHQVAPLSEEQHDCATCGTHYKGNYCPRCGQSAKIGRYSFKNAFLLFLDVWGLGNRGMFRSIRDLLLRPGYMIRDYLRGMQMAYFPPFKMYFLLLTLSLLVNTGLNIKGINREEQNDKETKELTEGIKTENKQAETQEKKTSQKTGNTLTKEEKKEQKLKEADRVLNKTFEWIEQKMSWVMLFSLLLFSCPLWLLFRHSPAIPDIKFSECFVAMVYITNMLLIYSIVPSFLCFSMKAETIYNLIFMLLVIIPIKQLSGYSYWSTIWRVVLATIILFVIFISLGIAGILFYIFQIR